MSDSPIRRRGFWAQYVGTVPYQAALEQQERLRHLRAADLIPDVVPFLQHPHVYTMGRFRGEDDIILQPEGIPVVKTDRGGSITYHGPGQLVGYPILDLREIALSLREYIWKLEEVIIRLLGGFGIGAQRDRLGGVWVDNRKICSIGINVSRHITAHGFAFNDGSPIFSLTPADHPSAGSQPETVGVVLNDG